MAINIGKNGKYILSKSALKHIIKGDFSDRQNKDDNNNTILTKIIAGGLHTISAWYDYLKYRPDVQHATIFEPNINEKWYYARELQNRVILLKIPRGCFQSSAARITKYPQTYYKSGYLWKTLFPQNYTESDIIDVINQALNNIDFKESKDSLIIGYAHTHDVFKTLKIRIQIRGDEILSAFPTWGQPMTGNNGKPFSHVDAINTVISGSTVIKKPEQNRRLQLQANWLLITMEDLLVRTPDFILNRKPPNKRKDRFIQIEERHQYLRKLALSFNKERIKDIYDLVIVDEYIRHPFDFLKFAYSFHYPQIKKRLKVKNAISVYQNITERYDLCYVFPRIAITL